MVRRLGPLSLSGRARSVFLVVLVGLLLALLYRSQFGLYWVGYTGDDVLYLSTGRALQQGQGYVDLHLPVHTPHEKYPPGYPALVALVEAVAPGSLPAQRWFDLTLAVLAIGLVWRCLEGDPERTAVCFLTATNAYWAMTASTVASEQAFTCAALLFCLMFRAGASLWLGVLAAAMLYLRTAGVVVLGGAILAGLSLRDSWRRQAMWLALTGVLLLPFYLSSDRLTGYQNAGFIRDFWFNLRFYAKLPLMLWGEPWTLAALASHAPGPVRAGLYALCSLGWLAMSMGAVSLWRRGRLARMVVCVVAVAWVFHVVYAFYDYRYFFPFLPWLYWLALSGAARAGRRATLALIVSAALGNAVCLGLGVLQTLSPPTIPGQSGFDWLNRQASPGDLVTSESPEVWLYTGHPVLRLNGEAVQRDPEGWLGTLYRQQVRWVLITRPGPNSVAVLNWIGRHPGRFRPAYINDAEQVWLFSLTGEPQDLEHLLQGRQALAAGDPARAAVELEQATRSGDLSGAILDLARAWSALGRREQALGLVDQVLRHESDNPAAQSLRRELLERR